MCFQYVENGTTHEKLMKLFTGHEKLHELEVIVNGTCCQPKMTRSIERTATHPILRLARFIGRTETVVVVSFYFKDRN